ncbi:expressed protein [Phakopsora pachyrhizi]|uniref:Expressed protein n=1 Tax=Phakopsora pachyrhizi TaxID=170000 RepID=A0AAV0APA4_PHAPC|nr:expressed protein [Phakopsora pachyrhizi]
MVNSPTCETRSVPALFRSAASKNVIKTSSKTLKPTISMPLNSTYSKSNSPLITSAFEHLNQAAPSGNNWQSDFSLNQYIYDYLSKRGFNSTASKLLQESGMDKHEDWRKNKLLDTPSGLLFEWWIIFWEVYLAKSGQSTHSEANTYIQAIRNGSKSKLCSETGSYYPGLSSTCQVASQTTPIATGIVSIGSNSRFSTSPQALRPLPPPHTDLFAIAQRQKPHSNPSGTHNSSPATGNLSETSGDGPSPKNSPQLSGFPHVLNNVQNMDVIDLPTTKSKNLKVQQFQNIEDYQKNDQQHPSNQLHHSQDAWHSVLPRGSYDSQNHQSEQSPKQPELQLETKTQNIKQKSKTKSQFQKLKQQAQNEKQGQELNPEIREAKLSKNGSHNPKPHDLGLSARTSQELASVLMRPPLPPPAQPRIPDSEREAITRQSLLDCGFAGREISALDDEERSKLSEKLTYFTQMYYASQANRAISASKSAPLVNPDLRSLPAHPSFYRDPMQLSSQGQRERQLGVSRANQMMANTQLAANTLSTSSNYSIPQIVSSQVSTRTSDVRKRNIASTSYHGLPPIVGPKTQPSDPSSPRGRKRARGGSSSSTPSPKISIQVAQSANDLNRQVDMPKHHENQDSTKHLAVCNSSNLAIGSLDCEYSLRKGNVNNIENNSFKNDRSSPATASSNINMSSGIQSGCAPVNKRNAAIRIFCSSSENPKDLHTSSDTPDRSVSSPSYSLASAKATPPENMIGYSTGNGHRMVGTLPGAIPMGMDYITHENLGFQNLENIRSVADLSSVSMVATSKAGNQTRSSEAVKALSGENLNSGKAENLKKTSEKNRIEFNIQDLGLPSLDVDSVISLNSAGVGHQFTNMDLALPDGFDLSELLKDQTLWGNLP